MHCVNFSNDNDSVDYDFFNNEEGQIKMCANGSHKDSSKIVTKAVIETCPRTTNDTSFSKETKSKQMLISKDSVKLVDGDNYLQPKSCPPNETKCVNKSLLNCLAYADEIVKRKSSDSLKFDDKECSDNSLSDSTLTTVTSDLTSISPCSLISDSSLSFEECRDSSVSQNTDFSDKKIPEINQVSKSEKNRFEQFFDENQEQSLNKNECKYLLNDKSSSRKITDSRETLSLDESEADTQYEHEYNDISALEEELGSISITNQSSTSTYLPKSPLYRGPSKSKQRRKETNLTFNRQELFKIERDNLILLKKIMSHSKPRTISLNYPFTHKKTSAAINRARQQKKIEQDNYVLYSKISAVGRMKKVF